jgi:hypothetical protein
MEVIGPSKRSTHLDHATANRSTRGRQRKEQKKDKFIKLGNCGVRVKDLVDKSLT